jgi:hypothetical protein
MESASFEAFGIDIDVLKADRRPMCRTCLDWSERRSHLAGSLGAALLNRFFDRRGEGTRVVRFTPPGEVAFAKLFT